MSIIRSDSLFSPFNVFNRTSSSQAFLFMVDEGRNSHFGECYKSKCSSCSIEKQVLSNKDDSPENLETENDNEWQRRKKIGLANKGRVPWNKGKKHNLETRKRIKQRTIEALRDPEVRRKMSEYPRTHSDQVKVKISSSLRRVWGKRLLKKRLNETFFLSWMESIAVAAKKGGKEEQELDWDSYDKIKQETLHQELQRVAEKEKLKAMRAENAKMREVQRRVRKKEKGDDNAKTKKLKMCSRRRDAGKRKGKEEDDNLRKMKKSTTIERSKLKQRLKKIRKKISINGAVTTQGSIASVAPQNTSWETLDLDLIKKGQMRKEASLADQIQVAKNRKAESTACKVLIAASTLAFQCTGVAER
ncbi:putative Serine/threonine-protein phosphatase 4 regulatory subunit 2-A [Cucumis melo var. makuwa]|nr:putative Serine/threonine-protein phosphatase 4 regulatory subunit 2-A [Cucumis melo var. makuwa]